MHAPAGAASSIRGMRLPHGLDARRVGKTIARTFVQAVAGLGAAVGAFDAYTAADGRNFRVADYAGWKHAAAVLGASGAIALAAAVHNVAVDPSRIPSLLNPPFTVVKDDSPGLSHVYPLEALGEHADAGDTPGMDTVRQSPGA